LKIRLRTAQDERAKLSEAKEVRNANAKWHFSRFSYETY
jgi:hypothetical protein